VSPATARTSRSTTPTGHGRVLLLSMPFRALERPSLGLSLLKAGLRRAGAACDIRYLGLRFAEFIGLDDYLWVHGELPYTAFAGDWMFTSALYGDRPDADARYVQEVLRDTWRLPEADVTRLLRIRAWCEHFLDHCMVSIPWSDYDVIGFTSTFEQTSPRWRWPGGSKPPIPPGPSPSARRTGRPRWARPCTSSSRSRRWSPSSATAGTSRACRGSSSAATGGPSPPGNRS
jgi:hypothetical protein